METGNIIALASVCVALGALLFNLLRGARGDVMASQTIADKLNYISDMVRETRDDVRLVNDKLDDHAARLTKVETKMDEHDRRIERLETHG